jgi:hypothetical protein
MTEGFVYIAVNPAHRDLVKIGGTERDPEERVKELATTGVPYDYVVVHAERVTDWPAVERALHHRFAADRIAPNREFFAVTARTAIAAAIEEATAFLCVALPTTEPTVATEGDDGGAVVATDAPAPSAVPRTAFRQWPTGTRGDPSFHTVQLVVVSCKLCGTDFSTALRRYEEDVRCPSCHLLQRSDVRW